MNKSKLKDALGRGFLAFIVCGALLFLIRALCYALDFPLPFGDNFFLTGSGVMVGVFIGNFIAAYWEIG